MSPQTPYLPVSTQPAALPLSFRKRARWAAEMSRCLISECNETGDYTKTPESTITSTFQPNLQVIHQSADFTYQTMMGTARIALGFWTVGERKVEKATLSGSGNLVK